MIGRSVYECLCDIKADVTQSERDTLLQITLEASKAFENECAKTRSKLANFAKVEYEKNLSRSAHTKTEEEKVKEEMDSASEHSARKRSYADVEVVTGANSQINSPDKRQKPVPADASGLSKLRDALASARTVLKL
ncbi:hypothetical protein QFC22_002285 [Naganishia vaughanmartiniae]|uniref:Uncharacterized protein n=1 Tax=Naganishia vaughanmartiniae TaxID=1424756 RepID=A0ACC2XE52_9TREE|nr:hypothetical protein QFC22_002285 [Naganishia vaughanmartiniae]